jgi:hypothetical protein
MAAGTIVARHVVDREYGYLYFVDAEGNVRRAKMKKRGKKKASPKRKTSARWW